ncbi:MAG: PAS domain S-box protein [Syntrophales bacterium]|jgi:PAS domain S-box-containing protein|nr:PAS domain S-box protein [Syntrophales bacterium]
MTDKTGEKDFSKTDFLSPHNCIDGRRNTKDALRESEKKYRLLAEKMTDIVWIQDMNLRTTYVSPSIKTTLGFTPEERYAQRVEEQLTPASMAAVADLMARELLLEQEGKSDPNRTLTIELEYYHKDGSTRWFENIISGIRDEKGVLIGIHGVSRDITRRRKAEEALKESEALLKSYMENAPDGIYMSDLDGVFLYGNRKSEEIIGYRREEVIGKNFVEAGLLSERDLNRAIDLLKDNLEGKPTGPDEFELIAKGGWRVPVEINTSVVQYGDRKVTLGFVRDIADRKKAETALRESEKKYRELVDFLPISLFEVDFEGNVAAANRAIFETFKYEPVDLEKGLNAFQLMIAPADWSRMAANIQRLLRGEKKGPSEYTGIRKDGSAFPFLIFPAVIVRDGKPVGLRGAIIDLTERKQMEESLQKSNLRLAEAQRIAHIGNWEWDVDSREMYWSDEVYRIAGLPPQSIHGTYEKFLEIVHPEDREAITEAVKSAANEGIKSEIGHRIVRSDGSVREVHQMFEPVYDNVEKIIRVIGIVQDVTEQKKAERELKNAGDSLLQSEKLAAIGRLSAGVAHEILNPVNIISMELQILQAMENLSPDVVEELKICMNQIGRIVTITENLKQFSRVPERKMSMADVNGVISHIMTLYDTQLKIEGIETEVKYCPDLPETFMDKEQIGQVIQNLIANAMAAMEGKEKKVLRITMEKETLQGADDRLKIMVADTGTGIKDEHLRKIFDPFFTTKGQGKVRDSAFPYPMV